MQVADLVGMALMMTGLAKSDVRLELGISAAGTATVLDTVVEVGSVDVMKWLM